MILFYEIIDFFNYKNEDRNITLAISMAKQQYNVTILNVIVFF